ncbi:MAG: hypothetical protein GYB68_01085 [Chloroflexi bacterium]|nr:hypothetical protein [Chloroflexota bacterium]
MRYVRGGSLREVLDRQGGLPLVQVQRIIGQVAEALAAAHEAKVIQQDQQLHELAHSPLMLSVMIMAYRGSTSEDVPDYAETEVQRGHLFETYVQRMIQRHTEDSPYAPDVIRETLGWLAKNMRSHGQSIFRVEDLQPSWLGTDGPPLFARAYGAAGILLGTLLWVLTTVVIASPDGMLFSPEAALVLLASGLAGGTMGWGLTATGDNYDRWWVSVICGLSAFFPVLMGGIDELLNPLFGAILYGSLHAVLAFLLRRLNYSPVHIWTVERLRFSINRVRWFTAALGGLAVLVFVMSSVLPYEFPDRLPIALIAGFGIALLGVAFTTGLSSDRVSESLRPNQGVRDSLQNGLRVGLGEAFAAFLVFVLVDAILNGWSGQGVLRGLNIAIFFFGLISFVVGFASVIQHSVLRMLLFWQSLIPWNYVGFLNHAARLALLKRVGGSYIFIHRYLLEYFADQYVEAEA